MALTTAWTTNRRLDKQLGAEQRRLDLQLREERERLELRLEHERRLGDLGDLRSLVEQGLAVAEETIKILQRRLEGNEDEEPFSLAEDRAFAMTHKLNVRLPAHDPIYIGFREMTTCLRDLDAARAAGALRLDTFTEQYEPYNAAYRRTAAAAHERIGSYA